MAWRRTRPREPNPFYSQAPGGESCSQFEPFLGEWPCIPGRSDRHQELHGGQVGASGLQRWESPGERRPMSRSPDNDGSAHLKETHGDRAGISGHLEVIGLETDKTLEVKF